MMVVVNRSIEEIQEQSRVSFIEMTNTYAEEFADYIDRLYNHALSITSEPQLKMAKSMRNPVETIEAIKMLESYRSSLINVSRCALYYHGTDYVLTNSAKTLKSVFAARIDDEHPEELLATMEEEGSMERAFYSTFAENEFQFASLVVFVPISLSGNSYTDYDATMIYVIPGRIFQDVFYGFLADRPYGVSAWSGEALLYSNGYMESVTKEVVHGGFLETQDKFVIGDTGTVFKVYDAKLDMWFLLTVPIENWETQMDRFRSIISVFLWIFSFVSAIFMGFAIYINYRPVRQLLSRMYTDDAEGISEFDVLERSYDRLQKNVTIQTRENMLLLVQADEQRLLMLDCLFQGLLTGARISADVIERLGMQDCVFMVLTARGLTINNAEREELAQRIRSEYSLRAYVSSGVMEDFVVIVCIMENECQSESFLEVCASCLKAYSQHFVLGAGKTVTTIEELHASYVSSLNALNASELSRADAFPVEEMEYFLLQLRCADEQTILWALASLQRAMENAANSLLFVRHNMHRMLVGFFDAVNGLGYVMQQEQISQIISAIGSKELWEILAALVRRVYAFRLEKEAAEEAKQGERMLAYVNENFCNADISLCSIGDEIGLSIYATSRLFKKVTGITFKSYITGKRLELAKQYLLETELSVNEISARIGLHSSSYFVKIFRDYYDMPPGEYRRVGINR